MTRSLLGRSWRVLASQVGFLLLLPALAGCGTGKGTVSGKVLYKGKAVPGGYVTFRPADGRQNEFTATIDENGDYEATVAAGEATICVDNRNLANDPGDGKRVAPTLPPGIKLPPGFASGGDRPAGPAPRAAEKQDGRYVPIPPKYYTAETSGLKYTVKRGSQQYDIVLE
jgi:hypothetical protein